MTVHLSLDIQQLQNLLKKSVDYLTLCSGRVLEYVFAAVALDAAISILIQALLEWRYLLEHPKHPAETDVDFGPLAQVYLASIFHASENPGSSLHDSSKTVSYFFHSKTSRTCGEGIRKRASKLTHRIGQPFEDTLLE